MHSICVEVGADMYPMTHKAPLNWVVEVGLHGMPANSGCWRQAKEETDEGGVGGGAEVEVEEGVDWGCENAAIRATGQGLNGIGWADGWAA